MFIYFPGPSSIAQCVDTNRCTDKVHPFPVVMIRSVHKRQAACSAVLIGHAAALLLGLCRNRRHVCPPRHGPNTTAHRLLRPSAGSTPDCTPLPHVLHLTPPSPAWLLAHP